MASIHIEHLSKSYTRSTGDVVNVLQELDIEINHTQGLAILGAAGTGKSTLLRLLADLEQPDSGVIRMDGESPRNMRLMNGFGMVFQTPVLYDWRTVRRNICMPMEIVDMPSKDRTARIDELIVATGLQEYGQKYPFELSEDLQQRVGVARALALDPTILYMDDPFLGYDESLKRTMNVWLKSLIKETGKLMVFATTDVTQACYLADKILVLSSEFERGYEIITFDTTDLGPVDWQDMTHQERLEQMNMYKVENHGIGVNLLNNH